MMKIGLQLYSMREHTDQIGLVSHLPAMGISQLEGYGGIYGFAEGYREAMDAAGVTMPSGHMALADSENNFGETMRLATTLGMKHIFAPYLDEQSRPTDTQGYRDLARRLTNVSKRYADEGLTFGWHNHDFEFVALPDGAVPMEILLDEAPEIYWEADLAWIIRGGRDPLDYIARYGARINSVHVKDIAAQGTNLDEDGWADLGAGVMDWPSLLTACHAQTTTPIFALEHDKPTDPLAYAKRSAQAFKSMWENTHDQ